MKLEELLKESGLEKLPEDVSTIILCIATDDDKKYGFLGGDMLTLSAGAISIVIAVAHEKSGDLDEQKEHVDFICEAAKEYLEKNFEAKKGEAHDSCNYSGKWEQMGRIPGRRAGDSEAGSLYDAGMLWQPGGGSASSGKSLADGAA